MTAFDGGQLGNQVKFFCQKISRHLGSVFQTFEGHRARANKNLSKFIKI